MSEVKIFSKVLRIKKYSVCVKKNTGMLLFSKHIVYNICIFSEWCYKLEWPLIKVNRPYLNCQIWSMSCLVRTYYPYARISYIYKDYLFILSKREMNYVQPRCCGTRFSRTCKPRLVLPRRLLTHLIYYKTKLASMLHDYDGLTCRLIAVYRAYSRVRTAPTVRPVLWFTKRRQRNRECRFGNRTTQANG